jgi:integrase
MIPTTAPPQSGGKAFRLMTLLYAESRPPSALRKAPPKPLPHGREGIARSASEIGFLSRKHEFEFVSACRAAISGTARKLSPGTLKDYRKKAKRHEALRPDPDSPPNLESHYLKPSSYYAHRAAARWSAEEDCRQALRNRDRAKPGSSEWESAVRQLKRSMATLNRYPAGKQDDIIGVKALQQAQALGLTDPPTPARPTPQKKHARASKAKLIGPLNQGIPDWREKVWNRLVKVKSAWLIQVAMMALAGTRPVETGQVMLTLTEDGALVFHVKGAKVSDTKGQPERTLTVRSSTPEAKFLKQQLATTKGNQTIPAKPLKDATAALEAAVRRAGREALGKQWGFSAYMYRHSLATDLKSESADREKLALVLGHSMTETSRYYGFWQSGKAGQRDITATGTHTVKINHQHGKVAPTSFSSPTVAQAATTIGTLPLQSSNPCLLPIPMSVPASMPVPRSAPPLRSMRWVCPYPMLSAC